MSCCKEKKTDCCSSPVNFKPDQIPNRLSEENAADFANLTIPMLREILRKLPLADLLLAASVCRHWHTVSNFVISTSSLCLCYRLKCYCESSNGKSPANVALDGHCCEADKSLKVNQIADFAESNLAKRVERLALCCPANIHDSDHVGVLPSDLFYLAKKFPNVNKLEFTGNDVDIFYIPLGRPVLSNLFPQISEILWFCDAPEYQIRLKCHQADNFMPAIKLDCKEKYPATLIAALAKVDSFIEALRAEGLVNPQTFSNTVAMRTFSVLMPIASLTFSMATEIGSVNVLAAVTELRLIVSEQQNLVQTLINLPNLRTLELDDEHRCSCIVRLPLLPQLTCLTLGIHSCALDRNLLSNVPKLEKLHIYSEQCGGLWLELLALNMCHLPLLETLILNCWEDSKLCCPCDIDDVLPDIVERAGRLKTLFLGSGVQPSLNGLRGIFACPTLRVVDCYLCATSENDKVVEQLIQILSGSSVEIMRTKVSLLTTAVAQTLQQMTNNVNSAETPKRKKWNAVELKWDTSDDLVITSNLTGDQLFRARKIPLNVPISRLKQLIPNFGRSPDPGLVCCEIPQLCGPQGPAFSCGGCISGPEIPSCDTQRCMSVNSLVHPQIKCLAARTEDIEPAPCCSEVCTSDPKWAPNCVIGCLKSSCRPSPKRLGKIIWIGWEDADLDNHYTNLARLLQMPNDAEKPTVKKHHWLQFICTEELVYK